ncbi:MAG: ATP-binding protein [Cyanobium sp.]
MWIPRRLEPRLRQLVATRPAVVLTGARQTGKTALARHLFPDNHYVSLDLPSEAAQAEGDPGAFLARHGEPLIIDEVQYAPALFRHLKLRIDGERDRCGRFLLTGSQPFVLMRDVADSLAGRAAIVSLEGLSLGEIRDADPQVAIEETLLRGGFPELWARRELDPAEYHASYVATYLERDLRSLLQVSSLHDFERFLRACALRSAQLLNRAELARDVGISGSTAAIWLSLLVRSGLVTLVEPWFGNATRRLTRSPKLYLADTGLQAWLLGIGSTDDLLRSPLRGAIWETAVLGELRRELALRPLAARLAFWRDRSREVDLLLERGGRYWLADAKWGANPGRAETRRLRQVAAELPQGSVEAMAVICRSGHRHPLGEGIEALPPWELAAAWGLRPQAGG